MIAIVWGSLAWAGELRLDLQAAIERAWAAAAVREHGDARVQAAQYAARAARAPEAPQLRLGVSDLGSRAEPLSARARVRQEFQPPGALRSAGAALLAEADELAAERDLELELLRLDTTAVFDALRVARAAEVLLADELVLARRRLELAERRLAAGLEVADDVVDAEVSIVAAVRRELDGRVERAALEAELALLVDAGPDEVLVLDGPPVDELALSAPAASASSAEVGYGRARVDAAQAVVAEERATLRPFLDWVEAGVGLEAGRLPALWLGAAVELPVFTSMAKGAVRSAEAEVDERRAELTAWERADANRRAGARRLLEQAQSSILAQREAIAVAEGRLAELGERVAPDRRVELEAGLLEERRRVLDLVEVALEARRVLEG